MKGSGAIGQTFAQTGGGLPAAGVLGVDSTRVEPNGANSGVLGVSTVGVGVQGKSNSGTAMISTSVSGAAMIAASGGANQTVSVNNTGTGDAIDVISTGGFGVLAATVHGSASGVGDAAVSGSDGSSDGGTPNQGVIGKSISGAGVWGFSSNYVGVNAVGGGGDSAANVPALSIVDGGGSGGGNDLIDVCTSNSDSPCSREAGSASATEWSQSRMEIAVQGCRRSRCSYARGRRRAHR